MIRMVEFQLKNRIKKARFRRDCGNHLGAYDSKKESSDVVRHRPKVPQGKLGTLHPVTQVPSTQQGPGVSTPQGKMTE